MAYGVTPEGFKKKTREVIQDDLAKRYRARLGASLRTDASSRGGQLLGLFSDLASELWDLAQAVDASFDPDAADGVQLDELSGITGTLRNKALASTVEVILTGDNATPVPAESQVRVLATGVKFTTEDAATLANATLMAVSAVVAIGDLRYVNAQTGTASGSPNRIYRCTVGGTVASLPPVAGASTYTDANSVSWTLIGEGSAYDLVDATCTETGPKAAPAGTIDTIDSPTSGWFSVNNILDAELGRDLENGTDMRARREEEAQSAEGSSSLPGVAEAVGKVEGVTSCFVFENVTDVTDVDGVPPHSLEVLVEGGDDAAIRQAIYESKSGGIRTHGSVVGNVTDSGGFVHEIRFSRPTVVNVYVTITLTKDPKEYPAGGDDTIKTAVVTKGDARPLGYNVVASKISSDADKAVPGVIEIVSCFIGTAPSPVSSTTLTITPRQRADFDTSRTVINSSNGTT